MLLYILFYFETIDTTDIAWRRRIITETSSSVFNNDAGLDINKVAKARSLETLKQQQNTGVAN